MRRRAGASDSKGLGVYVYFVRVALWRKGGNASNASYRYAPDLRHVVVAFCYMVDRFVRGKEQLTFYASVEITFWQVKIRIDENLTPLNEPRRENRRERYLERRDRRASKVLRPEREGNDERGKNVNKNNATKIDKNLVKAKAKARIHT